MENKIVGWIIVGISLLIGVIVTIFNLGLKKIIGNTCSHGPTCSMFYTVAVQTWVSLAIAGVILVIGLVIMFSDKFESKRKINTDGLNKDEKQVIKLLQEDDGAMFQKTLMEKLEIGKVGMTRLIDKLEAKQIAERKRRGMNNIVVLK